MFVFLVNTPSRGSQLEEMEVVVVVLVLLVEVLVELVRTDNFITSSSGLKSGREGAGSV